MSQAFKVEKQGPLARIVLGHAPVNTLDVPIMQALTEEVRRLTGAAPGERPRAIAIESSLPRQFSLGLDPQAVLKADLEGRKKVFLALADLVEAVWFGYVPVVVDISGPALAGGAVLAALADFALIDRQCGKICFSEVKVGLPIPAFVQRLIQIKTQPSAWNDILLLGRNIDAQEAVRVGLATSAYSSREEREEQARSLIGRIVRLPPEAVAETLRQTRFAYRGEIQAFRENMAAFAPFLTDEFLGRGLRAIVKGESPSWS